MEVKKSPKADLENKKTLFLEIGLIIALGASGIGLSMSSKPDTGDYEPPKKEVVETETVMNTKQDEPEPEPEIQKAQPQVATDVLKIVSNETKISTPLVFAEDASEFDDFDWEPEIEEKEEVIEEEEIFVSVEQMPTFQGGGIEKFRAWVMDNVKYPQIALENGIQGNVVVQFVVEKDGKIGKIQILRSPDKTLTDAAMDVMDKANNLKKGWKPGMQRNKPARVTFTLPITFKIQQ